MLHKSFSSNLYKTHNTTSAVHSLTVKKMERIRSCRDCANFEDRRDIDKVALCALPNGPHVCCEEFKLREDSRNPDTLYNRFCIDCANFEEVNGISICAKHHSPGVSCDGFKNRVEESQSTQQRNLMRTAILEYTDAKFNTLPIPVYVISVARKMKW